MEVIAKRSGVLPAPLETLKLGKTLGRGGFATVKSGALRAADGSSFPVAVKVLHPEYSDDSCQELRLFREEAQLMLQMDHQNIIIAYGLLKLPPQFPGLEGHTQPAYALLLELMEGGSLASLMVKQLLAGAVPKYTFCQALGWVIDVARALQYLHKGGEDGFLHIHRDVKMENVLLTAGMKTAKLADFGLQRAIFIQKEEQKPILVRRSQRPPPGAPAPVPRSGPAGPSRLAPDADRPTSRPRPVQRSSLGSLTVRPAGGSSERRRSEDGGNPSAVFYAIGGNGLTPLALPKSPQPSLVSPGAAAAAVTQQQQQQCTEIIGEQSRGSDVGRRASSVPQLEGRTVQEPQVLQPCGTGPPRVEIAPQAAVMPGQLVGGGDCGGSSNGGSAHGSRNNSNSGTNGGPGAAPRKSVFTAAQAPAADRPQTPQYSGLSAASARTTGLSGNSGLAMRPSPLGPMGLRPPQLSLSFETSVGECSLTAAGSGDASNKEAQMDGAPRTPEQSIGGDRAASTSERGPRVQSDGGSTLAGMPCAPGGPTSTSLGSGVCVTAPVDWVLPRGGSSTLLAPSGFGSGSSRSAGQGTGTGTGDGGARPSPASTRDITLSDGAGDDSRLPSSPPLGSFSPSSMSLRAGRVISAQRLGAGSGGSSSLGGSTGGNGSSVGVVLTPAAGNRCRLQILAVADVNNSDQDGRGTPGEGTSPDGDGPELLPGSANLSPAAIMPPSPKSGAKVTFAASSTTVASAGTAAPTQVSSEPGMTSTAREAPDAAARAWLNVPLAGRKLAGRELVKGVSCKSAVPAMLGPNAACTVTGSSNSCAVDLSADAAAAAAAPVSAPLQLADLLHMRLGEPQVSVRSVRTSASGMTSRPNGMGPAPGYAASGTSSPRLAAAIVAAGRPGTAGSDWSAAESVPCGPRRCRTGSLPTRLLEKNPVRPPVADFEEVFSLTGRTGSLMYLAPEAYKNEPYNDKVDVYSLAVLMYELFARTSITYTHISTKLPAFSRMLCNPDEFAERVAAGYRPPRTNAMAKMPPALWELIETAWHQDPVQRPDMDGLVDALEELVEPLTESERTGSGGGKGRVLAAHACGCVIC